MIIAFSGPAASGKGTLAKMTADYLGLPHYDFGLIFRAIAFSGFQIQFLKIGNEKAFFKGADVTEILKTEAVGLLSARVIRVCSLKDCALSFVKHESFVCDGRTCGTEIYPDADLKFFITADQTERFQRRLKNGDDKEIMSAREKLDAEKLKIPVNAIIIDTTGKTKEQSFAKILSYFR